MPALNPTTSNVGDKVKQPNKFNSILTAAQNAAIESFKAANAYGFALFSSVKSLVSTISAAFATVDSLANVTKFVLYDTTRVAVDTLYYQDEKAAMAAREDGNKSLFAGCTAMETACQRAAEMFSEMRNAVYSTIEGLEHTQKAMHCAWDAAHHTRDAAYDAFFEPADTAKIDETALEKILLIS